MTPCTISHRSVAAVQTNVASDFMRLQLCRVSTVDASHTAPSRACERSVRARLRCPSHALQELPFGYDKLAGALTAGARFDAVRRRAY